MDDINAEIFKRSSYFQTSDGDNLIQHVTLVLGFCLLLQTQKISNAINLKLNATNFKGSQNEWHTKKIHIN